MKKLKKCIVLFTALVLSLAVLAFINTQSVNAQDGMPAANIPISVNFELNSNEEISGVNLTVAKEAEQYQFWVLTQIQTDAATEMYQNIWHLFRGFDSSPTAYYAISDNAESIIIGGKVSFLVRIRKDGVITEQLNEYDPRDVGRLLISGVQINGQATHSVNYVDKANAVEFDFFLQGSYSSVEFELASGKESIPLTVINADTGKYSADLSGFPDGKYEFTVRASTEMGLYGEYTFMLYLFEEFDRDTVVIHSLSATGDNSQYIMYLAFADTQKKFTDTALEGYEFSLRSSYRLGKTEYNDILLEAGERELTDEGMIKLVFTPVLPVNGIYLIRGSIKRSGSMMQDDYAIYYHHYSRTGSVSQNADVLQYPAGTTITITSSGEIIDQTTGNPISSLEYAYYREDASGWVLIRDYSINPQLQWIPIRPGIYNIQVRMREANGVYEKADTVSYTITGDAPTGELGITIIDEVNGIDSPTYFFAGMPYRISVGYNPIDDDEESADEENILYCFTVYENNVGVTYLSKFQTSNELVFIPRKAADYVLSVRAILDTSYGYKQIEYPGISINSIVKPQNPVTIEYSDEVPEQTAFNEQVELPSASAQYIDSPADMEISVIEPDGGAATLSGNAFTASKLGVYTINYTAYFEGVKVYEQSFSLISQKPQPANLLQGFESGIDSSKTYINNNAGTKIGITSVTEAQYVLGGYRSAMIQLDNDDTLHLMAGTFIGAQDFRDYKSITINMHSSASFYLGAISMVWGSKTAALTAGRTLVAGWNAITITFDWNALAENSGYNGENIYSFRMYFGSTNGATIYFDNITYQYRDPEIIYESELDESVLYNSAVTVPNAQIVFQGLTYNAEIAVFAPDGSEVVLNNKQFTASQLGAYNVNYTLKFDGVDIYTATKVVVSAKEQPQNLLQGFDDITIDQSKTYIQTSVGTKITTTLNTNPSYVLGGTSSLKAELTSDATYQLVLSNFLGTQNLRQYSSITLNMYCGKSYYRGQISVTWTASQSNNNKSGSYVVLSTTGQTTKNGWTTLTLTLDWTAIDAAGNTGNLYAISFYLGSTGGDTIYFDNITFQQ